ncbi:MAG: plastocyanin/azurin family copper-binding protein [Nitrosopumilus sp.]|nr:plastocyanin/azurin family copper-binding protein [Nitrosopumilus sp.]MDH5657921.1 plastocyanin/azurin family copper-binding protein [Nitrosopumilus sp.]
MKCVSRKISIPAIMFSILLVSISTNIANAETIPEWVKNNALWYGQGVISETEFLNAIKFLIENDVLVIENSDTRFSKKIDATVVIPNGNSDIANVGFYLPLNLEIPVGVTVTWVNDDSVQHNIQSQDDSGKVTNIFNSPPLNTGDRFEYTFDEEGIYKYYCSWHPWRVGLITVN